MKLVLFKVAQKYGIEYPYLAFFPFGSLYIYEMLVEIHSLTDEYGGSLTFFDKIVTLIPWIGIPLFGLIPLAILYIRWTAIQYNYVLPILLPNMGRARLAVLASIPFIKYIFIWREL